MFQLTSSGLFRDAQKFESPSTEDGVEYTVTLMDNTFETAEIFECFLDIATEGQFFTHCTDPESEHASAARTNHLLYRFLSKWQCEAGLRFLERSLYKLLHRGGLNILTAFVIGSFTADLELCTTALRRAQEAYYRFECMCDILEPARWPAWVWSLCPPSYLCPLAQASNVFKHSISVNLDEEFEKRLDMFEG